jgi:SAM-dependent methyltransferase
MNPELLAIADEIRSNPLERSGDIYHPLPFREFSQLTSSSSSSSAYQKWKLIRKTISMMEQSVGTCVLDVGANAGFYSFNFAKQGSIVDAYEPHEHYVTIGRKIVEATGLKVNWHNKPLEIDDIRSKHYDVALMLSVFQWISDGNKKLDQATNLLSAVAQSSKLLFFELGCNHGKSAVNTKEQPLLWIWRLLEQATSPKHVSYLGTTSPWRGGKRFMFACSDDRVHQSTRQRGVNFVIRRLFINSL